MKRKRPLGLKIIVTYKAALFLLLSLTSVILLLALENHSRLIAFSESYILESKLSLNRKALWRRCLLKSQKLFDIAE